MKAKPKADMIEFHPAHPPDWCVAAVHARGEYPGVRPIEGVIQAPTMRLDGSILDQPGYDPATRLYLKPNAQYESIPKHPTRQDAEAARDLLLDVVCDFPFKTREDVAVWLTVLETVIARSSFNGPAPLFGSTQRGRGRQGQDRGRHHANSERAIRPRRRYRAAEGPTKRRGRVSRASPCPGIGSP